MLGFLSNKRLAEIAQTALATRPDGPIAALGDAALAKALTKAGFTAEQVTDTPPDGDTLFAGLVAPGGVGASLPAWTRRLADGARILVAAKGDGEVVTAALLSARVLDLAIACPRPLVLVGRVDARLARV